MALMALVFLDPEAFSIIPFFVIRVDQSVLSFSISTSAVAYVVCPDAMVAASAATKDFHGWCSLYAGGEQDDEHVLNLMLA